MYLEGERVTCASEIHNIGASFSKLADSAFGRIDTRGSEVLSDEGEVGDM